jgi:hypothetical protein
LTLRGENIILFAGGGTMKSCPRIFIFVFLALGFLNVPVFSAEQSLAQGEGWFEKAKIPYFAHNYGSAISNFEMAVASSTNSAKFHLWLGRATGLKARRSFVTEQPYWAKRTCREFEKAVSLDPEYVEAMLDLLEYYISAPSFLGGGMDKAEKLVERIKQLDPVKGVEAAKKLRKK